MKSVDRANRKVTVQDESGETETIDCPPEVKRFDEDMAALNVLPVFSEPRATSAIPDIRGFIKEHEGQLKKKE